MSDYDEALRKMLRKIRTACGLTQREVAEALHVNRSTYTYYESGKTKPGLKVLKKVAAIYDVPIEVFLYPEKFPEWNPDTPRRFRKLKCPSPQKIGDLRTEEKELIAKLRMQKK